MKHALPTIHFLSDFDPKPRGGRALHHPPLGTGFSTEQCLVASATWWQVLERPFFIRLSKVPLCGQDAFCSP